ncbi:hypothetical protein, partial [Mixta calida]|uniref:hypothetical protein n=1 Tax=Mixta calida TaxID=665913 RepID=UPI00289C5471
SQLVVKIGVAKTGVTIDSVFLFSNADFIFTLFFRNRRKRELNHDGKSVPLIDGFAMPAVCHTA